MTRLLVSRDKQLNEAAVRLAVSDADLKKVKDESTVTALALRTTKSDQKQ